MNRSINEGTKDGREEGSEIKCREERGGEKDAWINEQSSFQLSIMNPKLNTDQLDYSVSVKPQQSHNKTKLKVIP